MTRATADRRQETHTKGLLISCNPVRCIERVGSFCVYVKFSANEGSSSSSSAKRIAPQCLASCSITTYIWNNFVSSPRIAACRYSYDGLMGPFECCLLRTPLVVWQHRDALLFSEVRQQRCKIKHKMRSTCCK